jgi:hypothetical protein
MRVRSSATVEISPNSFISTDLCKTLLGQAFASMVAADDNNVVSKRPSYILLSLCTVFSEGKALGEDESEFLCGKAS